MPVYLGWATPSVDESPGVGLCKHEAAYSLQDEQEGQQIKEYDDSLQKEGEFEGLMDGIRQ